MTTQSTDGSTATNVVELLPLIAQAMANGKDPIEDPTREGGIFVDDEIIAIATDMELVLQHIYIPRSKEQAFFEFYKDLLAEMKRASEMELDPVEEVSCWLEGLLHDEEKKQTATVLSA